MRHLPSVLLGAYILLFVWMGISPYDRAVWWAENIPIMGVVVALTVLWFRGVRFSNTAYALMSVLVFLHTIGGHYTFERVPFQWFSDLFSFERNMYDRVAHFTVGFYAFAFAEYLATRSLVNARWLVYFTPLVTIMAVAASYELLEWWFAATFGGSAGAAFLGSQGDIWDAQKDIWMDTLGAVAALTLFFFARRSQRS